MIKRKHIVFLFQLILLLFVARLTYTTISYSLGMDHEKTSMNLFDYSSSDNTEEESNDEKEKEEIIADEEFIFLKTNPYLFANTFIISTINYLFVSKNALQSIFIPPPELV